MIRSKFFQGGFWIRDSLSLLLLLAASYVATLVILRAEELQTYERDLALLNDARYGLFDAHLWADQIAAVLEQKIDRFSLNEENKPRLKRQIERILDRLLVAFDAYQRQRVQTAEHWWQRLGGALRQRVQDLFIDLEELREQVPQYSEQILKTLAQPETKEEIRAQLKQALHHWVETVFTQIDRREFQGVLDRYGCKDAEACRTLFAGRIRTLQSTVDQHTQILLGLAGLAFLVALSPGIAALSQSQVLFLTLMSLVLCIAGIFTPMIAIEAKIQSLRLAFLGESIVFTDQVLYFQSKSVVEVVQLLFYSGKRNLLILSMLIGLFSILFPIGKLIASYFYFHSKRGRRNRFVRFLALQSGKWSMADVFVVALFMAYTGFYGLLDNQLSLLAQIHPEMLEIFTTNGTRLQAGFYLFLGFSLSSIVISTVLDLHFRTKRS